MSAKLATKPSRALLTQLESMLDEVQTPECRHWLEQELEGYSLCSHLPWYRIVACRQRGHFLDLKTGKYLTCHINSQTLSQRDWPRFSSFMPVNPPPIIYCNAIPVLNPGQNSCWKIIRSS